ncbi:MAG: hypothetical protein ACOX63_00455 [Christensenellales bacterium]
MAPGAIRRRAQSREAQRQFLEEILIATGYSFSDLIYHADGTENMEASQRVEIKFRLREL